MVLKQQHSIRQLCFDVEFTDKSEVISFQNQLSDLARNQINTILDETLSKYATDKIISIDHCEIDLGIISKEHFRSEVLNKVEKGLNDLFSDILGGTAFIRQKASGVKIINQNQHFIDYFGHYLAFGHLPWNVAEKQATDNFFKERIGELLDINSPELKNIIPFLSTKASRERFARIAGVLIIDNFIKRSFNSSIYGVIRGVYNEMITLIQQTSSLNSSIKSQLTNLYGGYALRLLFRAQTASVIFDQANAVNEFVNFISEEKKLNAENWIMPILHELQSGKATPEGIYLILQKHFIESLENKSVLTGDFFADFNEKNFIYWLNTTRPEIAKDIVAFVKKATDKVMSFFPSVKRERIARIIQLQVAEWLPMHKSLLNNMMVNTEQIFLLPKGSLSTKPIVTDSSKQLQMRQHIVTFFKIGKQLFNLNEHNSSEYIEKIILHYANAYPEDFNALIDTYVDASPLLFWHIKQIFSATSYKQFIRLLSSGKNKALSNEPYEWLLLRHIVRKNSISWTVLFEGQKPVYETLQMFLQQNESQFIKILKEEKRSGEISNFINQVKTSQIKLHEEKKLKIIDKLSIQLMEFLRGTHAESVFGGKGYFYALIRQAALEMPVETSTLLLSLSRADVTRLHSVFSVEQKEIITRLIQKYNQVLKVSEEKVEKEEKIINLTDPIFIFNAGLVLLNPFLSRLFDKSGLIENKDFKTEEHRQKAMVLLHYLATGQTNPSEHELVFNKILTGADPSSEIELNITISQDEKDLCDSLLDAAVSKWTALKKTSRDNLRGSFLLRDGRLIFEQEGWRLSLEQKAYDILIDQLPWGYTTMKYPWMKYPIYTEWR